MTDSRTDSERRGNKAEIAILKYEEKKLKVKKLFGSRKASEKRKRNGKKS